MSIYCGKIWERGYSEGTKRWQVTEEKYGDVTIVRVRNDVKLLGKNLGTWLQ